MKPLRPESNSSASPGRSFRFLFSQARTTLAISVLVALSVGHAQSAEGSAKGRPNILVILADDLGFSDIGAFGGEIDTPNLDGIAREGVRLTDFHSGATCSPTRSMLLSGVDHHVAGIGSMAELTVEEQRGKPGYEGYLNDRVVAFPQLLQHAGYRTYMSGKWHLGLTEERSPKARGFDRSFALLRGADDHYAQPWNSRINPAEPYYREDGKLTTVPSDFYSSDFYADKLVSYLKEAQDDRRPFFAYLTFTAPHWPLQAPESVIQKYVARYQAGYEPVRQARLEKQKALGLLPKDFRPARMLSLFPAWQRLTAQQQAQEARRMAVYAAMVDIMDRNIGKVISQLKASGQYDNTVILFMSDNGAEGANVSDRASAIPRDNRVSNIGRASSYASYGPNWAQVSALPFNLYKGYSHEGGTTVPAIVRWPGGRHAGQVVAVPGHVTDVAPTLLQLAGVSHPEQLGGRPVAPLQGRSLVSLFEGGVPSAGRFEQGWELFGRKAYRQGDWKIVLDAPPTGTGDWQLFNLRTDRAEQIDLAAQHAEKLAELKAGYEAYAQRNGVIDVPHLAQRVSERYSSRAYFEALEQADAAER